MNDCAFLLELLSDGEPHALNEILACSIEQRGHGLTVHSRAADLRAQGHTVQCKLVAGVVPGRVSSTYQLLSLREQDPQDADSRSPLGGVLDSAGTEPSGSRSESNEGSGGPMRRVPTPADAGSPVQLAFEVAA